MELRIWVYRAAGMAKIFFIFAAAGFIAGYAAMAYFGAPPQKVFATSMFSYNITVPVDEKIEKIVESKAIMIFMHNGVLAFLFMIPVFLAGSRRFKNLFYLHTIVRAEDTAGGKFDRLCVKAMGLTADTDKKLITLSFFLNTINWLSTGILAFMLGAVCVSAAKLLTPFVAFVSIATHGIIEIPAFWFAAAFPPTLFTVLKNLIEKDPAADAFVTARNSVFTKSCFAAVAAVFVALSVAAYVEAEITPGVIKHFKAQSQNAAH